MAKKQAKKKSKHPLSAQIFDQLLVGDEANAETLVVLVIPSHDEKHHVLSNQPKVVDQGMKLLADLFGGATQFAARGGIWYSEKKGEYLRDRPVLLESYARVDIVADFAVLDKLVGFMKQVGRDCKQDTVAFALGDRMHFLDNYRGAPKQSLK